MDAAPLAAEAEDQPTHSESCSERAISVRLDDVSTWPGEWVVGIGNSQKLQHITDTIEDSGAAVYIPRVGVLRTYKGKRQYYSRPLFGGYIFISIPYPEIKPDLPRAWELIQFVHVPSQPRLRRELALIQLAIGVDPHSVCHQGLREGAQVEIISGPLRGFIGTVERYDGKTRLFLAIETLGQSLSVEIPPEMVDVL